MTGNGTKPTRGRYVDFARMTLTLCVGGASMLSACTTKQSQIVKPEATTQKPAGGDTGAAPVLSLPAAAGTQPLGDVTAADSQAAADVGLSTKDAAQGRLFINGWDGTKDEAPASTNWSFLDVLTSVVTNAGGGALPPASATVAVNYTQNILPILATSCNSCHSSGGQKADVSLTDYGAVRQIQDSVVARVVAGTMPQGGLAPADRNTFAAWKAAGYPKDATNVVAATGSAAAATAAASTVTADGDVEFHIKKGTAEGAWNAQDTEVVAKVGKKFTIINDDDRVHQWHTNGAPCEHGSPIAPGASETCVPQQAYQDGPLYDHITHGKFYIRAE